MKGKKSIEFLHTLDRKLEDELKNENFQKIVKSSYAPNRLESWYGYSSNLQSIKEGRVEISWERNFPDWLQDIRDVYFPEANSALLCRGNKPDSDTSIEWHRDHGTFENRVVMVNLGKALFYLQDYVNGTLVYELKDGDVIDFDSKLLHKSVQTSNNRTIITFRKLKTEFSSQKLF